MHLLRYKRLAIPKLFFEIKRLWKKPQRLQADLHVVPTWFGSMFLRDDAYMTPDILRSGVYDLPLSAAVANNLKSNMNVLNIGANVGYFCLLAAHFSNGKIFAFEPDPTNFEILQKNMLPYANRITCIPSATSDKGGLTTLWLDPHSPGNHSLSSDNTKESGKFLKVPATTIDDFLDQKNDHVDMIIMDVQGAEILTLQGMKKTLRSSPPRILFIEFWPYGLRNMGNDPTQLRSILHEYGYILQHIGPTSLPDPETQWDALIRACDATKNGKGFCNLAAMHTTARVSDE